ncbi:MAG: hypothetical protein ACI9DK_002506 [Vicingaceae bacterium]|jgi:hypothetical protein
MNRKIYLICISLILFAACTAKKHISENDTSIEVIKQKTASTFSNWDNIVSSLELSNQYIDYWSEVGVRGRYKVFQKYLSKATLENIVGEKAFLNGLHTDEMNFNSIDKFGYYNPLFLTKLHQKLKVLFANNTFVNSTQAFYDEKFKQSLRVQYLSYKIAVNNDQYIDGYLDAISEPNKNSYMNGMISGPSFYIQESFRNFAESIENQGYNVYEGFTFPGFWVRRSIDGTADEFHDLMLLAFKTFDPEFVNAQ